MKINFQHPVTKKPSSVNLPDHWLSIYELFVSTEDFEPNIRTFVNDAAAYYYQHYETNPLTVRTKSFTHYCEKIIAYKINEFISSNLPDLHQSRLIATPSNGKAVSRSEIKTRGKSLVRPKQSLEV
jgi:hypothetical protein